MQLSKVPKGYIEDTRTGEVFDLRNEKVVVLRHGFEVPNHPPVMQGRFLHVWPDGVSGDLVRMRPLASLS